MAVAVVAILVSGCGGDSGTASDSASLSQAEYVKEGNKICAERKKAWDAGVASYEKEVKAKKGADPREIAEQALDESIIPALSQELEAFEELGAPVGKEKQVNKFLKNLSKPIQNVEKEGVDGITEAGFGKVAQEAKALGLTCPPK
jgi:hypothetical protein